MDKEEARKSRLDVNTYHQAVDEFCSGGKQADKLMIVAFEKGSGSPAAVLLLKKKAYDPVHLRPLGGHPIEADMTKTTRKLCWELSYCIRRADQRSMCLGDICISCGIEEVFNRAKNHPHGASTIIWLILAGGFKNTPALRLYLAHGFGIIGLHAGAVMMALSNVDDGSVSKTSKLVVSKLESTFLLPLLKQRGYYQSQRSETDQDSQEAGPSGLQDPTSQGSVHSVQSGDHEREEPDSQHSTVASGGGFVPLSQESQKSLQSPGSQGSNESNVNTLSNSIDYTNLLTITLVNYLLISIDSVKYLK